MILRLSGRSAAAGVEAPRDIALYGFRMPRGGSGCPSWTGMPRDKAGCPEGVGSGCPGVGEPG